MCGIKGVRVATLSGFEAGVKGVGEAAAGCDATAEASTATSGSGTDAALDEEVSRPEAALGTLGVGLEPGNSSTIDEARS
jgi:hypothetical protein